MMQSSQERLDNDVAVSTLVRSRARCASPASYQSYVNWSAAIGARDLLAARPVAAT